MYLNFKLVGKSFFLFRFHLPVDLKEGVFWLRKKLLIIQSHLYLLMLMKLLFYSPLSLLMFLPLWSENPKPRIPCFQPLNFYQFVANQKIVAIKLFFKLSLFQINSRPLLTTTFPVCSQTFRMNVNSIKPIS